MQKGRKLFNLIYLFQAEDSTTVTENRIVGACKAFLWLGVSILMGVGVSSLS